MPARLEQRRHPGAGLDHAREILRANLEVEARRWSGPHDAGDQRRGGIGRARRAARRPPHAVVLRLGRDHHVVGAHVPVGIALAIPGGEGAGDRERRREQLGMSEREEEGPGSAGREPADRRRSRRAILGADQRQQLVRHVSLVPRAGMIVDEPPPPAFRASPPACPARGRTGGRAHGAATTCGFRQMGGAGRRQASHRPASHAAEARAPPCAGRGPRSRGRSRARPTAAVAGNAVLTARLREASWSAADSRSCRARSAARRPSPRCAPAS